MTLADILFVLNKGVVEQAGAPLEVFARPATRFVAQGRVVAAGEGAPLEVGIVEALGAESHAHGSIGSASFVALLDASAGVKKGDVIHVAFAHMHMFDAQSGASLRSSQSA